MLDRSYSFSYEDNNIITSTGYTKTMLDFKKERKGKTTQQRQQQNNEKHPATTTTNDNT